MKKSDKKPEKPTHLKRKLMSALAMLMVATTLMATTSYAWFVLSTAPEVTGISTNVGANGSLEIALLNTETRGDMSTIRSGIGDSMVANNPAANNAWGNLVDLGYQDYGLDHVLLMPSRLNVVPSGEKYAVDPGMLAIPTYGYDGRIVELTDNTLSAVYQETEFALVPGVQDYGVRAIGTSNAMTVQESSLALAKSNIPAFSKSARTNAVAVMANSGNVLFNIVLIHATDPDETYTDEERDAMAAMLADLGKSLTDIDAALRQGLMAFAASEIADETLFNEAKDSILDTSTELKKILETLSEVGTVPGEFADWVNALDKMQNNLKAAKHACELLEGGTYTWAEFRGILDYVMNVDQLYIFDDLFENVNPDDMMDKIGGDIPMTLAPGSGIYAEIADFVGNYKTLMTIYGTNIQISTASQIEPSYLTALVNTVNTLKPASGEDGAASATPLTAIFGYALDLAFRCNTEGADLVLQTAPKQRVYNQEGEESTSASTQGGGSYMEFRYAADMVDMDKRLALMDAIRVGFLDDQGMLLGIAKLNTYNYVPEDDRIWAPLYMYEYAFETDETGIFLTVGDRRDSDSTIIPKEEMRQNVPKAITVVVWLDGDLVDNTMVSAKQAASLSGVLNLQFSTNAELIPAQDSALLNYTADKTGLETLLQDYEEIINEGQGTYTTVSWNAFASAYDQAQTAFENDTGDAQIRKVMVDLTKAAAALETVSKDPVNNKIAQLRQQMGTVEDDTARLVIQEEDGGYAAVGNELHTQEQHDSWNIVGQINRVDYTTNLKDEGNGIYTSIYSEESWKNMAGALYDAEAVVMNDKATDAQLNAALNAIETAEKALQRQVFFKPYTYKGAIYYEAICEAENADSYGKWYDSEFNRIISDLTMLNLNAYAEPATITEIEQNEYVASDTKYINPDITFLDEIYAELRDEEVMGVKWDALDSALFAEVMNERHLQSLNNLLSVVRDEALDVDITSVQKLVDTYMDAEKEKPAASEASEAIQKLNDAIVKAMEEKAEEEAAASTNMTSNQRTLLMTAVNTAKTVSGYEDPANSEREDLRTAVQTAEELLSRESAVTKTEATEALASLNTALKAAKEKEVTEYNTLTHKLPEGTEAAGVVYDVEYPGITVGLKNKSGNATLGAQILTKNGIVVSVSKNITIYDRAEGVKIYESGRTDAATELELHVGGGVALTAKLGYPEDNENLVKERITSYSWASSDAEIAAVTGKDAELCTIEALKVGTTKISVSVQTREGNTYTHEIELTVK